MNNTDYILEVMGNIANNFDLEKRHEECEVLISAINIIRRLSQYNWTSVEICKPEPNKRVLVFELYSKSPFIGYIDEEGVWHAVLDNCHTEADGIVESSVDQHFVKFWAFLPNTPHSPQNA